MSHLTNDQLKQWANQAGFDFAGVAAAAPVASSYAEALRRYLARHWQGRMSYLEKNLEKRLDPRALLPEARSVICVALSYYHEPNLGGHIPGTGKIARFAWRPDYHVEVKKRLGRLAALLRTAAGRPWRYRLFVDTAPVLEKYWAWQAGLGWIGKHTLLVNQAWGSWLVLGGILCDLEIPPDAAGADACGDCSLCLSACPAAAFHAPRQLEARRCLSYFTVEGLEAPEPDRQKLIAQRAFGCDVCQEVCPYNRSVSQAGESGAWVVRPDWQALTPGELAQQNRTSLLNRFAGSCLEAAVRRRAKAEKFPAP